VIINECYELFYLNRTSQLAFGRRRTPRLLAPFSPNFSPPFSFPLSRSLLSLTSDRSTRSSSLITLNRPLADLSIILLLLCGIVFDLIYVDFRVMSLFMNFILKCTDISGNGQALLLMSYSFQRQFILILWRANFVILFAL